MKWFLDTEFYERPGRIDLISIGLVSSTGLELYAENCDFPWGEVPDDHWLQANVRPHLKGGLALRRPQEIARLILDNVGNKPEFWGWYCDYDWVVFCWIFGRMIDLPEGFPMFCRDLRQRVAELHIDPATMPEQTGTEHNALEDARWNRLVYEHLRQTSTQSGGKQ